MAWPIVSQNRPTRFLIEFHQTFKPLKSEHPFLRKRGRQINLWVTCTHTYYFSNFGLKRFRITRNLEEFLVKT